MNSQLQALMRSGATASSGASLWSSPSTWGGPVPQAGEPVLITSHVVLNTTTNSVGQIEIGAGGWLEVSSSVDSWLKAEGIRIRSGGRYTSGTSPSGRNLRRHRRTLTGDPVVSAVRGLAFDGPVGGESTATGNNAGSNDAIGGVPGLSRGLLVESGGIYEVYGYVPTVTKTFLQGHHYAGATTLVFADVVEGSFEPGDEILIGPTGFYRPDRRTEKFTILTVSGNTVTIASPGLGYDRWGLMQYMTDTGISLAPGTYTQSNWSKVGGQWVNSGGQKWGANAHTTLDQRARVCLLTRRHAADSPADSAKTTYRHGHHDMYMIKPGDGGKVVLYGVEARDAGQGGLLGRYPFHFHANSIVPNTATNLGPLADGQAELHDCVTNGSFNRAFTYHACQNVKNYGFTSLDVLGHAIFLESGAEKGNTLYDADVFKFTDPGDNWRILAVDSMPAGLWATNLGNRFARNRFADGHTPGWITLTSPYGSGLNAQTTSVAGCYGIARSVLIYPRYTPPLEWTDNVFHTSATVCKQANATMINERGDIFGQGSGDFNAEGTPTGPTYVNPTFDGDVMWKGNQRAYINEFSQPHYTRQLVADNGAGQEVFDLMGDILFIAEPVNGFRTAAAAATYLTDPKLPATNGYKNHLIGNDFSGRTNSIGATADGVTAIDTSLNNWDAPTQPFAQRVAFDSYHFTLTFRNVSMFGYQVESPPFFEAGFRNVLKTRAALGSWDLYLNSMEFASRTQVNWNILSAGPVMYLAPGPHISAEKPWVDWLPSGRLPEPGARVHNHTASVLDYYGTLFRKGSNVYGGPDHPFVTYDDANVFGIPDHNGTYLGMAGTTTKRIGINTGTLNWYNAAGVDQWKETFLYQRCQFSDFADYLTADAQGRLAQWRNIGQVESGMDDEHFGPGGGGGNHTSAPSGAVLRVYNPNTATNFGTIAVDLEYTESDGTALLYIGFPMDTSKTIAGNFAGITFASAANLAALKAATVSTLWKDATSRTGAPNGIVWTKCRLPVADGSSSNDWRVFSRINLTAT